MTEALSLNDFASQLSAASEQTGQATDAPEAEGQELPETEETTSEVTESEGEQSQEGDETEATDSEDGQAEKAPDEEMVIKWKTASGESYEAPLKELKDGYLRHSDYTQKAQQLSQERERAQAAVMQQFEQVQAFGPELGRLQGIQERIAQYQSIKQSDWQALQAQDPQQYNAMVNDFLLLREQGKEITQSIEVKKQRFALDRQQEAVAAQQAASEHLRKAVKDFGDKHLAAMNDHMLKKGLKTEDLTQVVARLGKQLAPAVLEAIHEAAQWRALQDKKPDIANRAKAIPPKPAARAQQAKPTSQQEQLAKVAASGKPMSTATFAELLAQTRRK
jgi:hypothetical protein